MYHAKLYCLQFGSKITSTPLKSFFAGRKMRILQLGPEKNYSCNKQSIVNKVENGIGLALRASPLVNVSVG